MSISIPTTVSLDAVTCCTCGTVFGISTEHHASLRQKGREFYCPNGHVQVYGKSENQRLREELARAKQQLDQEKARIADLAAQRDSAERRVSAQKAVTTRLKNKAARGHCPCCDRLFPDLAAHMAAEHPDFEGTPEQE